MNRDNPLSPLCVFSAVYLGDVLAPATGKFIDIKWVKVYLSGIRKEIDLRALRQECQCIIKDLLPDGSLAGGLWSRL